MSLGSSLRAAGGLLLFLSNYGIAQSILPEWVLNPDGFGPAPIASGCAAIQGNANTVRTIAVAKARAEISRQLSVNIESTLEINRNEASSNFSESIMQRSQAILEGMTVLKADEVLMDGGLQFCVLMGLSNQS